MITSKFEAATLERVKELCDDIGRYWFCGAVKDLHSVRGISSTAAGEGEVFAWLLKAGESLTLLRDSFLRNFEGLSASSSLSAPLSSSAIKEGRFVFLKGSF